MASGDTAVLSLAAGKVTDTAGNPNTASTSTDNAVTYDGTAPSVTVNQAAGQADPTNTGNISYTIVFSEPVTVFTATDITLAGTGGYVSSLITTDNITFTAAVAGMTSGDTVTMTVTAGVAPDTAGNPNTASTSTDNAVTYDSTAPAVSLNMLITSDTTPALSGSVNDPTAVIKVTVNGTTYTATNNGNGTWTLPDNTISPALADGTYDVTVTATDAAGNSATTTGTGALTIDTAAPTGTVNPVPTGISNSPAMSGTVSDATATVIVTINGQAFTAANNGDGTWTLPAGTINPGLAPGTYTATVTFKDAASNTTAQSTTFTVQRSDADLPTVNPLSWVGGTPIIAGTYDAANSLSLRVCLAGSWYVLGVSPELSVSGSNWTLNLTTLSPPLAPGTYDVFAEVTTRSGQTLVDRSSGELTILTNNPVIVVTNPTAGVTLAQTGVPVWGVAVSSLLMIFGGIAITCKRRTQSK